MRQEIKCPEYFNRGNVNNRNWIVLLFIVASCVILGFGVLLMRKSTVMLWIYVIVSLLTIVIECLYIFKHKHSQSAILYHNKIDECNDTIKSLNDLNTTLNDKVSKLNALCLHKDVEISDLSRKIVEMEMKYTLAERYVNILQFFQDLDRNIEDLPDTLNEFKDIVKHRLSKLMNMYGYKFIDFKPENIDVYDCEYYAIEAIDIVGRTIADNNGNIILKGKIYLPNNYETR